MEKFFIVVCRKDNTLEGVKGEYVLATRTAWTLRAKAEYFANTCHPSREAMVIEAPRGLMFRVVD